jgi:hypothetical protein
MHQEKKNGVALTGYDARLPQEVTSMSEIAFSDMRYATTTASVITNIMNLYGSASYGYNKDERHKDEAGMKAEVKIQAKFYAASRVKRFE